MIALYTVKFLKPSHTGDSATQHDGYLNVVGTFEQAVAAGKERAGKDNEIIACERVAFVDLVVPQ